MALTKRSDGRWCKSKTIKGKKIYFYSSQKTERMALRDIENQIFEYSETEQKGKLFKNVAAEWERIKRDELDTVTWNKTYRAAYAQIVDVFSEFNIKNIKPFDIDCFFKRLKSNKFSRKYVATRKSVLNMIFEHAFICGYISNNFIPSVPMPSGLTKTPRKIPSENEIEIVKSNYTGDDFLHFFLAYTGLRVSEACAITDKDIDYKNNLIYITKKIVWNGNSPILKNQTKTEAGVRTVPLLSELKKHMPANFNGYLFSRTNGETPYTQKQLRVITERYKKRHNVSFTLHQLRHAFASLGVEAELSVKELQYIMGHTDIHTTMDIYAEIRNSQRKIIAEKMNSVKY